MSERSEREAQISLTPEYSMIDIPSGLSVYFLFIFSTFQGRKLLLLQLFVVFELELPCSFALFSGCSLLTTFYFIIANFI